MAPRTLPIGALAAAAAVAACGCGASAFVQSHFQGATLSRRHASQVSAAPARAATRERGVGGLRLAAAAAATNKLNGKEIRGPLQPVDDTVIVLQHKAKEQTAGGLFLPSQKKEKPNHGTVVANGPGKRHWESGLLYDMEARVGDNVVFAQYGGTEIDYNGEGHLLLRQDDILFRYPGEEVDVASAEVLGDRLLVKVVRDIEPVKASGIVIAATAVRGDQPTTGEVVKVGKGRKAPSGKEIPLFVQVGDQVKFRDFAAEYVAAQDLKVDGVEYIILKNADVIAKW